METKQIRVIVGKGKERRVLIIDWDLYGAAEAAMGIGYGDRWIGREISQFVEGE